MTASTVGPTRYHFPQWTVARFVARRTVWPAVLWGLVIGLYVYASAVGFQTISSNPATRARLLAAMSNNVGLKALVGDPHQVTDVHGFIDWRVTGIGVLVVSIWALLTATRSMRGEEAAGRWELFLAGRTTGRRATANALTGLYADLLLMYVLVAAVTTAVGTRGDVDIGVGRAMLFAAVPISGAALFLAVGALASQLMATRAQAVGLSTAVFGVAFMLRAIADTAPSAHTLVYASPFGWIEQMQPLTQARPVWFAPIAALTGALVVLTLVLAGRDLGKSTLADRDTAVPHTRMLGGPIPLALRLSSVQTASWLAAALVAGWLYGSFAKSAGESFASAGMLRRLTGTAAAQAQQEGVNVYAGVIFLMLMTLTMVYVASAVSGLRRDEAEGYLDNLLVRSVSRQRWLAGRAIIAAGVVVLIGVLGGAGFWVGAASTHAGMTVDDLLLAGLNSTAPGLLLLGFGVCTVGFAPRLTSVVTYGLLAWSFLLEFLGSAITINHWLMDTSLLHHITLAPAVDPNWLTAGVYLALAALTGVLGIWRFTRRDLQSE